MKKQITLLVTDLDNTLWNWVHIWYSTFNALLTKVSEISGIPAEQLEAEFKAVHQKHGTTEYAFSLQEMPSILRGCSVQDIKTKYAPAITAFREARAANLHLYPGVIETLRMLRERRCLLVGYTESLAFYSLYRMRQLNLDLELDFLYSPPDADLPANMTREQREQLERYPKDAYSPRVTVHRHTPKGAIKPNPEVLRNIIAEVGGAIETTAYVGDSELKDIAMAQAVGVADCWAKYGTGQGHPVYELLRRVTHWPDKDVKDEKTMVAERELKAPNATYVLDKSFTQLMDLFEWIPFGGHDGDNEAFVVFLSRAADGSWNTAASFWFIAAVAHEGTLFWEGRSMNFGLNAAVPTPDLWVGEGKHGNFVQLSACEPNWLNWCVNPGYTLLRHRFINVGEPRARFVDDLAGVFSEWAGYTVWNCQRFKHAGVITDQMYFSPYHLTVVGVGDDGDIVQNPLQGVARQLQCQ